LEPVRVLSSRTLAVPEGISARAYAFELISVN
jgi:hypothetical protein